MKYNLDEIKETYPFLTCIRYHDVDYIGIMQNHDDKFLSFYDLAGARTEKERSDLLSCGDVWWWESARVLPINIFIYNDMRNFKHCLKTFSMKEIEILFGPVISLKNIVNKRAKRKQIQLIRKQP